MISNTKTNESIKILNMDKITEVASNVVNSIPLEFLSSADWETVKMVQENIVYDIVFALIGFLTSLLPVGKYENMHQLILSNDREIYEDILYRIEKTTHFKSYEEWENAMLWVVTREYTQYIKKNFI